jgi:hypothetical protein
LRQPTDARDTNLRGEPVPGKLRRTLWRIRKGIAPVSRPRIRACGYAMKTSKVSVLLGPEGRARYCGPQRCGSIWECPMCNAKIKAKRAAEISYCVESHGIERCAMLTLTVRHGAGDDLRVLAERLSDAWRAYVRGEPYKRHKERLGLWHSVRAVEVTHGVSGFHPHIHILILLRNAIPAAEIVELNEGDVRWLPPEPSGIEWIVARWQEVVARVFGEEHVPDDMHGVHLAPCHRVDYLSKLGLELSDPGVKRGRHENRAPLEIADDYARAHLSTDGALWSSYCAGMKGRKQLTWSAGAKRAFGLRDRTDQELADDEDPSPDECVIGVISRYVWDELRSRSTKTGVPVLCWLLEQAEKDGPRGFDNAMLLAAAGEV